jgi:hypothetical protein
MKERSRSRVGWLLLIFLALVLGPGLIQKACPRSTEGRPSRPAPDEWSCAVEVGDRRYLAYDRNDDGRVDCFFAVGLMRHGFRATDFQGRCTRSFAGLKPMDEAMRAPLDRVLELRWQQRSWSDWADDVDSDGVVDCIRGAPAGRILVTFEGGRCEAGDEWTETGDPEQQDAWNEILRHEKQINAIVAGSGD